MVKEDLEYQDYLNSGRWACQDSPTGAHHWVQITTTEQIQVGGYFRCKYCGDVKKFPISYVGALEASHRNTFSRLVEQLF